MATLEERLEVLENEVKMLWEAIGASPAERDPKTLGESVDFMQGREEWLTKGRERTKARRKEREE